MARDPTIAYVFLRNSVFGPKGAASVELCVRDLIGKSRYARSTLVVCPKVDEPFEGIEIETVHDVAFGGNLAKAWAVGQRLKRRGVDVAVVENHLPAAAVVAASSGRSVILHSHAYEKAASGALKRAQRGLELKRLAGLAFVSEDCLARFRMNFPGATAPMRAIPNGLDMREWSSAAAKDKVILSVGRGLDDKGHREAMAAIARVLKTRPDWSARFILSATRPRAGHRPRIARRRGAVRRTGADRRQSALRRGQGGLGQGRGRHGADQDARALRPHRARSYGERRGAGDVRPRRTRRGLRSGRADGRSRRRGRCGDRAGFPRRTRRNSGKHLRKPDAPGLRRYTTCR